VKARRGRPPTVITSLAASRAQDIAERQRRYVIAMLIRVVFLVAAVVIFHGAARVVGMVVAMIMPWLAVVFANQPRQRRISEALDVKPPEQRSRGLAPGRGSRIIDPD
jgi:Flp pilus assembly protein TadB